MRMLQGSMHCDHEWGDWFRGMRSCDHCSGIQIEDSVELVDCDTGEVVAQQKQLVQEEEVLTTA
jgi:hypothetical protein